MAFNLLSSGTRFSYLRSRVVKLLTLAVVFVSALYGDICGSVSGNLVANCGFETGTFADWTVSANETGVFGSGGPGGYSANSGSYYAYLGNVGSLGTVSQTLATTSGDEYELDYYFASNGTTPNQFEVEVNGTVLFNMVDIPSTSGYLLYTFDFTASGATTLTFLERDDPNFLALDDVSVTNTSVTATPEPTSIVLMLTLLVITGMMFRRNRVRNART
jgi:hypothetical protein